MAFISKVACLAFIGTQAARVDDELAPKAELTKDQKEELALVNSHGLWDHYYASAEAAMDMQWKDHIFPMIRQADFSNVLEIACGECRNTEKLFDRSPKILATDINADAIKKCEKRFKGRPSSEKVSFAVVDGVHVKVPDSSVSFIYQFDSGVHMHKDIIRDYLKEFARVLEPGGTGFFHHSNLGATEFKVEDNKGILNTANRQNMTATLFEQYAKEANLEMICHPIVTWSGHKDLDAFARFRKAGNAAAALKDSKEPAEECPTHISM